MSDPGDGAGAPIPERIGRYRVSRLLGSGAFATVYLASDDALDIPVALKVLAQNWSFEPEVRRRFIQEAQLLRRVDGSRVVRVHDIGETDEGQPFFVMDYAARGTIEDRLLELASQDVELDASDVLRFCRHLAAGIEEVHRLQVAHRDLKPSNLLLRTVDDPDADIALTAGTRLVKADERVVVSDLGLAKDLLGPTRLTVAAGTPGYMAPEQHDPSATIDERADVYACTAVLQRVVAGVHPEPGGPLLDPDALDELPPAVTELLLRGLAEEPDDRFESPAAWLLAVEEAMASLGRMAAPPVGAGELVSGLSQLSGAESLSRRPSLVGPTEGKEETDTTSRVRRRYVWLSIGAALATVVVLFLLFRGDTAGESAGPEVSVAGTSALDPSPGASTPATSDPDRNLDPDDPAPTSSAPVVTGDAARGETALDAVLVDPVSLSVGPNGRLAVAEQSANRVRSLSGGVIEQLAGTGRFGFSGDTGPATEAELSEPLGIDHGSDGSLYIVDSANAVIRRVDGQGRIQVVAGSGQPGNSGDGGLATSAAVAPTDVAVMSDGSLLIADINNGVVRWVNTNGIISTVIGPTTVVPGGALTSPVAVESGLDGSFVVADLLTHRVLKVSGVVGPTVTLLAGTGTPGADGDGGNATEAQLAFPSDVALDIAGQVYIADRLNHRVRRVSVDGVITTVAGTGTGGLAGDEGPAVDAELWHPIGVAVGADGVLYIADGFNNRVRSVDGDGTITTVAGSGPVGEVGDGGPATDAPLADPFGIALDGDDVLLVENWSGRLRRIAPDGTITTGVGSLLLEDATRTEPLITPTGLAVAADGSIAVTESGSHRVTVLGSERQVLAGQGTSGYSGDGGAAAAASLSAPTGVAWTRGGDLLIADSGNHRLRRVSFTDAGPVIFTVAGTGDLVATPDGRAPEETALLFPYSVVEAADGAIYVSEAAGSRVRRIADGTVTTVLGTGVAGSEGDGGPGNAAQVDTPSGLALGEDGSLYVADLRANRVRRVAPDGTVSTVAGDGAPGYSGDGGPGTAARLNAPSFLALEGTLLHIVDTGNRRVRTLDLETGRISTTAGAF